MSGLFEHLAATDDTERVAGRQAVSVANKRVKDQLGGFLSNATNQADLNSRMSLVIDDIQRIAAEVGEEYGVVAERVEKVIRNRYGNFERQAEEQKNIDELLADAPSAVGHGTIDGGTVEDPNNFLAQSSRQGAEAPKGSGGAVKREKLPKGNADAQGGPSPKIDKSKAGDEKGHKHTEIDTEGDNSPVPNDEQDVTAAGRGDVEKGTSDYSHSTPELTSDVLKKEDLPTADKDAQNTERNIEQPSTGTFPKGNQADPVTSRQANEGGYQVVPSTPEHCDALGNCGAMWMPGPRQQAPPGEDGMPGPTPISYRPLEPGNSLHTVLNHRGEPVAMFDRDMHPNGVGYGSEPVPEGVQPIVDENHRAIFGQPDRRADAQARREKMRGRGVGEWLDRESKTDPDRNPIRDIIEELDNDMSAVAEYERTVR